ncbi:MAG: sulfopyruvate decarboxylase subunit alpha [Thermodesulfobacteriota bacterium]
METPSQSIADGLKKKGIKYVVSLPDNWTGELLAIISADDYFIHIPVAREDEGVGICAALHLAGADSVLIIQNSSLLLCGNALKSLALKYRIPLLILVSNRGALDEYARNQIVSARGLLTVPFLEALQIPYLQVPGLGERGGILKAHRFAKIAERLVALILTRRALGAD